MKGAGMYIHNKRVGGNQVVFWQVVAVVFILLSLVSVLLFAWAAQPLDCDDMTRYEDGSAICVIKISNPNR